MGYLKFWRKSEERLEAIFYNALWVIYRKKSSSEINHSWLRELISWDLYPRVLVEDY